MILDVEQVEAPASRQVITLLGRYSYPKRIASVKVGGD